MFAGIILKLLKPKVLNFHHQNNLVVFQNITSLKTTLIDKYFLNLRYRGNCETISKFFF